MGKLKSDILKLISFGLIFTSLLTSINPTEVKALGYKDNSIDTLEEGDILKAGETYTISNMTYSDKSNYPYNADEESSSDNVDGSKIKSLNLQALTRIDICNVESYTGIGYFYDRDDIPGGEKESSTVYDTMNGTLEYTVPSDDKYNYMVTEIVPESSKIDYTDQSVDEEYVSYGGFDSWTPYYSTPYEQQVTSKNVRSVAVCTIEDSSYETIHGFSHGADQFFYGIKIYYKSGDAKLLKASDLEITTQNADDDNTYVSSIYIPEIKWRLIDTRYYVGDIDNTAGDEYIWTLGEHNTFKFITQNKFGMHLNDAETIVNKDGLEIKGSVTYIKLNKIPKETIVNTTLDANQTFEGGKTYQFMYYEHTTEDDTVPDSKISDKYSVDNPNNFKFFNGSVGYGGMRVQFDDDTESYKNLTIRNQFGSSYLYYKNTCEIGIDQYNTQGNFIQQNSYSWNDFAEKMGGTSLISVVNTITFPEGHNWRYDGTLIDKQSSGSGTSAFLNEQLVLHFVSDATQCDVVYRSKRTGEELYTKTLNVGDSIELTDADKQAQPKLNDYLTTEYYSDIDGTEKLTDLKAKGYKMYVYIPDNKCYIKVSSPKTYLSSEDELLADSTVFKAWVKRGSALDTDNITFLKEVWDLDTGSYVDKEMSASDIEYVKNTYDLTKLYTSDMKEYDTSNIQTDNLNLFATTKAVEVTYYTADSAYKDDSNCSIDSRYVGYAYVNRNDSMLLSDITLRNNQGEVSQDELNRLKNEYDTTKLYDKSLNIISEVADIPIYLTYQTVYLAPLNKNFTVTFLDSERNESYNYDTIYEKQVKWGESGELTDTDKEQCTELESFNTTKYYNRYSGDEIVDISKVYRNTTVYLRRLKFKVRYIDYDTKDIIDTKMLKKGDSARIDFTQSPFDKYADTYFDKYGYRTTPNSLDGISGNMDIYLKKNK